MAKGYEIADAYVRIMPSFKGVSSQVSAEVSKNIKGSLTKSIQDSVKSGVSGLSGSFSGLSSIGSGLGSSLNNSFITAGNTLKSAMTDSVKIAGGIGGIIASGVGAQIAGGGLQRALSTNESTSKLTALGYQGETLEKIMSDARSSVDGTAYSLAEATKTATGFLAAGMKPGEELENSLKNVAKLSDISGRNFDEMGSIMSKASASGIVQMDDLNQILDSGIPILSALSESLGITVQDVRKLSSEGKISFNDLNNSISNINFDSQSFASMDFSSALKNMRAQLSKTGEKLWTPIITGAVPVFNNLKDIIRDFNNNYNFSPIINSITRGMDFINIKISDFKNGSASINVNSIITGIDDFINKAKKLKDSVGEYILPISGLIAGALGKSLSGIPLIGGLFSGLSPLSGLITSLFAGALIKSDDLKNSLSDFGGFISTLMNSFKSSSSGTNFLEGFGDGLAKVIVFIHDLLSGFIKTMGDNKERVFDAISDVFNAIGGSGINISGDNIGSTIGNIIVSLTEVLSTSLIALADIGKVVGSVLSSDIVQGLFSGIISMASYILSNERIVETAIVLLTGWFVLSRLTAPLTAMSSFMSSFKGGKDAGSGIGQMISGLLSGLSGLGMGAIKGIAVLGVMAIEIVAIVGAVMGAMSLLGAIFTKTNAIAGLQGFAEMLMVIVRFIADSVGLIITALQPVLDFIGKVFIVSLDLILNSITGLFNNFINSLSGIIESIGISASLIIGSAGTLIDSFSNLFYTLSTLSPDTANNIMALSVAMGALMASMGIGSVMAGAGQMIGNALGGGDIIGQLTGLLTQMNLITTEMINFSSLMDNTLIQSQFFGTALVSAIVSGILSNSSRIQNSLNYSLNIAMVSAQNQLNRKPLIIPVKVGKLSQADLNGVNNSNMGNVVNNTNTTFNLQSNNDNLIRNLINKGRY